MEPPVLEHHAQDRQASGRGPGEREQDRQGGGRDPTGEIQRGPAKLRGTPISQDNPPLQSNKMPTGK